QAGGDAAKVEAGRVELGNAGGASVGPIGVRNDLLFRPAAAGHPGQGERGAHDLEKLAARGGRHALGDVRELGLEELLELGRVRQLLDAAPMAWAHLALRQRWHIEQSVNSRMPSSCLSLSPSSSCDMGGLCSISGFHSMLVIWSSGRRCF